MKSTFWVSFFCLSVVQVNCVKMKMVEEYFTSKGVTTATIFACSIDDYISLFKTLMRNFQYVASGLTYLEGNSTMADLMRYPYYKLGVYLDYTCDFGKEIMLECSHTYILNASYVWFVRINSPNELQDFEKFNLGMDSDFIVAMDTGVEGDVDLIDLYKLNSTSSLITTPAGFYSDEFGLSIQLNGTIIGRRSDFQGFTFNTAIMILDLNVTDFSDIDMKSFLDHTINPESDLLSRCVHILCTYLMKMLNFTANISITNSFGYPNQKGPILHDGLIGKVESKAIDFGWTPAAIHIKTRMDVSHFAVCPIWMFRLMFTLCHPRTQGTYKALVIPFTAQVWLFVICLTFFIGLILTFIKYFSVDHPIDTDKSLSGNIIITIGALYQQGLLSCSNKIPERIVLFFTLTIGMMIVTFYNSMIVTSLLRPPPKYINTPQKLQDSSFKLVLQNHPYAKNLFERSTDPLIKAMFQKVKQGPGYVKPADGVKLIQKSEYAFYSEEPYSYRIIEETFTNEEICLLQEIEVEQPARQYLPVRRNSPLLEFFHYGFLRMREVGVIQVLHKRWHPRKPICQNSLTIPPVGPQSVLIAYTALLVGIVLSLLILLAELLYSKYKVKREKPKNTKKLRKKNKKVVRFNN